MSGPTVVYYDSPVAIVDQSPAVSVVDQSASVALLDAEASVVVSTESSPVSLVAQANPIALQATSTRAAIGTPGILDPTQGVQDLLYPAAQIISGGRVLVYSPADGGWIYAIPASSVHAAAQLAVALAAATAGETLAARASGSLDDPAWSWPAPCTLWLGISGQLTATPPSSGYLRAVARAVSSTRIVIDPEPAVSLAA